MQPKHTSQFWEPFSHQALQDIFGVCGAEEKVATLCIVTVVAYSLSDVAICIQWR